MKTPAKFLAPTLAVAVNLINCTPTTDQTEVKSPATIKVEADGSTNPQALPQDEEARKLREEDKKWAEETLQSGMRTLQNLEETTRMMIHTVLVNDPAHFASALKKCSESPKQERCDKDLIAMQKQGCNSRQTEKRYCNLEIQLQQLQCKNKFSKCFAKESGWITQDRIF